MSIYRDKYEKYKHKYLELKEQIGGDPSYAYIALINPADLETEHNGSTESPDMTEILLIKLKNKYNLPGGKIKKGEAPLDTALRIFKEHTGYNNIDNIRDKFTELIIKKTIIFYYAIKRPEDEYINKKEINKGMWFNKKRLSANLGYNNIDNKNIIKTVIKKAGF